MSEASSARRHILSVIATSVTQNINAPRASATQISAAIAFGSSTVEKMGSSTPIGKKTNRQQKAELSMSSFEF